MKPAPTGPISAAARSASGCRQTSDSTEHTRERQITGGGQPGRRDMHIHDPHRVALLPVGGGEEQAPDQAERGQRRAAGGKPRQHGAGQTQKAPRIGETVQGAPRISLTRGRGNDGTRVHAINLSHAGLRLKENGVGLLRSALPQAGMFLKENSSRHRSGQRRPN